MQVVPKAVWGPGGNGVDVDESMILLEDRVEVVAPLSLGRAAALILERGYIEQRSLRV